MIQYHYDQEGFTLKEQRNEEDMEFLIAPIDPSRYLHALKRVREHFEADNIHTDVLFYVHKDHEYQIIVRPDFYVDFILCLFKYRIVLSVAWI